MADHTHAPLVDLGRVRADVAARLAHALQRGERSVPTKPGAGAATFAQRYEAGDAWLAGCSAHPDLVRAAWDDERLAPVFSGPEWLIAETQLVVGMPALSRIHGEHRGPVLADPVSDRAWWLVPLGAAEELADVRSVSIRPAGWPLHCPPTGRQIEGRFWLTRPDGSGRLTAPTVLAAAFGPGGGIRLPSEAS